MQLNSIALFVLFACVNAQDIRHTDVLNNQPITEYWTNTGEGNLDRVTRIVAIIRPGHLGRRRTNFGNDFDDLFERISEDGDDRGHLVASQFGGPAVWYNLSPQSPKVNRNLQTRHCLNDWCKVESEMKNYLQTPGEPRDDSKYVIYTVKMSYVGTSNRPDMYELMVKFMRDPAVLEFDIEAGIKNPLPGEKVSFSFCRKCKNENSNPECDKCG